MLVLHLNILVSYNLGRFLSISLLTHKKKVPAIYETEVPVSMAKMIMSRHVGFFQILLLSMLIFFSSTLDTTQTKPHSTTTARYRSTTTPSSINGLMLRGSVASYRYYTITASQ